MGRYSFFIFSSFINGYSVSATGELDNDLLGRNKQYLPIRDDFSGDNKNLLESGSMGGEQEEIKNAEILEESENENRNESLVPYGFEGGGGSSGGGGASLGDDNRARIVVIERWISDHNAWAGNLNQRVNNINSNLQNQINSLSGRVSSLENWKKSHDAWAGNLANKVTNNTNRINTLQVEVATMESNIKGGLSLISDQLTTVNSNVGQTKIATQNINNHIKYTNELLTKTNSWLSQIYTRLGSMSENIGAINIASQNINEHIKNTNDLLTKANSWLSQIYTRLGSMSENLGAVKIASQNINEHIKNTNGLLTEIKDFFSQTYVRLGTINTNLGAVKIATENINNKLGSLSFSDVGIIATLLIVKDSIDNLKVDSNGLLTQVYTRLGTINTNSGLSRIGIENINNKLGNLSFSDAGIIASLLTINGNIDSFRKDFNDLFGSSGDSGLNAHEGSFTRTIKSLFIALRNDIRDLFSINGTFWNDLKELLDIYFDINNKDSGFYRIRYSIVAGFTELQEVLETIGTDTLNLRKSLIVTNDYLNTIIDWLKLIYQKPTGSVAVTVPPFDFNRLEEILKSLSFGNVVNEAGTNFWDFMKELIKNLGEIFSTAIGALSDIVQKILDLLGDLVDTVLSLIIPKDWNFLDNGFGDIKGKFDVKFKSFLDLGDLVKGLFKPTKKDFLKAISFTWFGANFDFTKSQPFLDIYVPKFRLAMAVIIWALTAVYIYRKFTGTGDVINDN